MRFFPRRTFFWGFALILLLFGRVRIAPPDLAFYYSCGRSLAYDLDFCYANEYSHFRFAPHETYLTKPGYPANDWPIGTGIAWIPFLAAARLAKSIGSWIGGGSPPDGYGWIDQWIVTYGSTLLYGGGTLWLSYFYARRMGAAKQAAIWATAFIGLGSSFTYHLYVNSADSHAPSAFFIVIFLLLWRRQKAKPSFYHGLASGCALGMAALIRPHNLLFLLTPILEIVWDKRNRRTQDAPLRKDSAAFAALLAGTIAFFFPQMLLWKQLYGSWLALPRSEDVFWLHPHLWDTLFSDFHGMISWSPLFGLGLLGLSLNRRWLPLAAPVMLQLYIYSCNIAWWSGGSFGNRRMLGCVPLLILGLAGLFERIPKVWLKILAAACALWTWLLLNAEVGGAIRLDHYQKWSEIILAVSNGFWNGIAHQIPFDEWQNHFAERLAGCAIALAVLGIGYVILCCSQGKRAALLACAVIGFNLLCLAAIPRSSKALRTADVSGYNRYDRFSWVIYYEKGFYLALRGRDLEASESLLAAVTLEPSHSQPWMYIGEICRRLNWTPLDYHYFCAAMMQGQRRDFFLKKFVDIIDKMIDFDASNRHRYYNQRGVVHALLGESIAAEEDFRMAALLDPDFIYAKNNLQILRERNQGAQMPWQWK
ncbi:MAG: hypothetical protein AB1656_09550 [Candidatus Omnitrophota bacterium]